MSSETTDGFVWAVTLEGDEATRRAGASARRKADELRGSAGSLSRLVDRVFDRKTEGRSWRRGAEGEEEVARRLAPLESRGWTILHDLTIGARGANVDHLAIGPGGVFCLNTKHLTGTVEVRPRTFRVNGYSADCYPKVVREAERVAAKLAKAMGAPIEVRPVIVVMGAVLTVIAQPEDVTVLGRKGAAGWFDGLPQRLTPDDVTTLVRAARRPSTWTGRPSQSSTPLPVGISVKAWKRSVHDRLYVNLRGSALGYLDRISGDIVVKDESNRSVVEAALEAHRRSAS